MEYVCTSVPHLAMSMHRPKGFLMKPFLRTLAVQCKGFLAVENPFLKPFYFVCRPI